MSNNKTKRLFFPINEIDKIKKRLIKVIRNRITVINKIQPRLSKRKKNLHINARGQCIVLLYVYMVRSICVPCTELEDKVGLF